MFFFPTMAGNLPPHAVALMKEWGYAHIEHPFPSEEEKRGMAAEGGITYTQVGLSHQFTLNPFILTSHIEGKGLGNNND